MMSWGWKIILLFGLFVTMVLVMVFLAVQQEFHLVADNYYEKEIQYQGEIDKIKNARSLKEKIKIDYHPSEQAVVFTYPAEQKMDLKGEIYFFRPSDSTLDQKYLIKADPSGQQKISVKSLKKGLWQIKINWSYGSDDFQEEKNLMFQ